METISKEDAEKESLDRNCEKHGIYQAKIMDHPLRPNKAMIFEKCPACEKEAKAKRKIEQAEAEASEKRRLIVKAMRKAGLTERYFDLSLANLKARGGQDEAISKIRKFYSDFVGKKSLGKSMIIAGTVGTGKTHICQAMINDLVRLGRDVRIETARSIIRRVRSTWEKGAEMTETQVINRYSFEHELLIIDEVGVQFGTESEQITMFDIIDGRYEERLPTILITNLDIEGLTSVIGERVIDRLRDDGGELIAFNWESLRG